MEMACVAGEMKKDFQKVLDKGTVKLTPKTEGQKVG